MNGTQSAIIGTVHLAKRRVYPCIVMARVLIGLALALGFAGARETIFPGSFPAVPRWDARIESRTSAYLVPS
ncbi:MULTISPECIES: hypothetical protein [Pseudomonas]|uniref:Uncharacterized protein n=1 Tax=Pseudomonas flavocrustae TaxID=2991719 RepID=A0ABT6IHL6_9PSED|nr:MULTISPECIES: hypothetical protein [unclassified Pseudomonas]MDH4763529.1 hypothetical protein [Pseudomonas sp. CBMAI 2609]